MATRIWILIGIDLFFGLGLIELLFLGGSQHLWSMVTCMALIAYVTWSIVQLIQKAKSPPAAPK
jgi:hypothetical protein